MPTWHVLNRRFFKLNFVSCTISLFGLGWFLDSIEHDFIRSEILRLARHDRLAYLDKYQFSEPVMVSCEFNSHCRQFYLLLKIFKTSRYQILQKCQICVISDIFLKIYLNSLYIDQYCRMHVRFSIASYSNTVSHMRSKCPHHINANMSRANSQD